MNTYINETMNILRYVTLKPGSTAELVICLGLAVLLASFALTKVAKAFSFHMADMTRALLVTLITLTAALAVTAGLNLHIAPKMAKAAYIAVLISSLVVVALAVGGLMCKFILKGAYIRGVISLVLSLAAGVTLIFLANGIFSAIKQGSTQFDKTKKRTEEVNKQIN